MRAYNSVRFRVKPGMEEAFVEGQRVRITNVQEGHADFGDFVDVKIAIIRGLNDTKDSTLQFTPEAAQWVRHEQWHPQQEAKLHGDGSLTLRVPYTDATELAMDILRHGPEVEVLAPDALRQAVRQQLEAAVARYRK